MSRSKCSTPTCSASSASIRDETFLNTLCSSLPSPINSSTASYVVVGIPVCSGLTSMIAKIGSVWQNRVIK